MINRSAEEYMTYYKGKVLNLIIANPSRYSLWDIENRFGLNGDKIEQFILEYNKMGFEICIKKGKYLIKESRESVEVFLDTAKRQESELHALYESLKEKSSDAEKISIDKFLNSLNSTSNNKNSFIKELNYLERDGLIFLKNRYIHVLEPLFQGLEYEKILKLLIFINVVRNLYPKRNLLNSIFRKLLLEYENRGFRFNMEAVQYISKCKMSLYEEIILNIVEDAIYYDKSLEFSYRTQVGAMKIKINPSGIIYNNQKDMWYVVTLGERRTEYRMDKMTNVRMVEGGAGRFVRNLYEYSMGISGESLTDVKAAFKKEDYIYKKLLNYIKLRKSAGIRKTNNAYILTDRVCGTNEFKKWIRAFGEDAVCLKPDKLREEILMDVKLLRERYGVV
jgi:hypothetical protein